MAKTKAWADHDWLEENMHKECPTHGPYTLSIFRPVAVMQKAYIEGIEGIPVPDAEGKDYELQGRWNDIMSLVANAVFDQGILLGRYIATYVAMEDWQVPGPSFTKGPFNAALTMGYQAGIALQNRESAAAGITRMLKREKGANND
jgi:hypothetical protein